MYPPSSEHQILDAEHLRLLRIGYFVSAAVTGFFALFGLLYMGMGTFARCQRRSRSRSRTVANGKVS